MPTHPSDAVTRFTPVKDIESIHRSGGDLPAAGMLLVCCLSGTWQVGGIRVGEGTCRFVRAEQVEAVQSSGISLVLAFRQGAGPFPETAEMPFDPGILSCMQALLQPPFAGLARDYLLEARCLELLARVLTAAEAPVVVYRFCKTEYDRERLAFARDYLLSRPDFPPTIPELARIAGINEFKLKNGFRELYGAPIHRFILQHKLDTAADSLRQGAKSPSQLAFELGFSSLQHFSKAFKNQFGVAPVKMHLKTIPPS